MGINVPSLGALHRWIGLTIGVWLMLMGLSGVTLVFHKELDEAFWARFMLAGEIPDQPDIEAMLQAVHAAYPDRAILSFERYGLRHDETYPFVLTPPLPMTPAGPDLSAIGDMHRAPSLEVFVDPATARIIGARDYWTWFRLILSFHQELLVPETGERVVGVLGLTLLATTIVGVVLWWRQGKRNVARALKISWSSPRPRFYRDIHTVGGIYVAFFLSFQALTGAIVADWYQVSTIVAGWFGTPPALRPSLAPPPPDGPIITPNAARDIGLSVHPNADVVLVSFPLPAANFYSVRIYPRDQPITRFTRQSVIEPHAGRIIMTFDPSKQPFFRRLMGTWMIWIHSGQFFGLPGRLIVLATGMMLTLMFPTGLYIWLRMRRSRKRPTKPRRAARSDR